jgi:sucrose-6-phosphate hydrolase SacC (GH32 family)
VPGSQPPVFVFKASLNFHPFGGQDAWLTGSFTPQPVAPATTAFVPHQNSQPFGTRLYDYGLFYASKTFFDTSSAQRQVLFGWVNEEDDEAEHIARGWAGVQSLPREVSVQ